MSAKPWVIEIKWKHYTTVLLTIIMVANTSSFLPDHFYMLTVSYS